MKLSTYIFTFSPPLYVLGMLSDYLFYVVSTLRRFWVFMRASYMLLFFSVNVSFIFKIFYKMTPARLSRRFSSNAFKREY